MSAAQDPFSVSQKLNGTNYAEWAMHMQSVLKKAKVWRIVTKQETEPVAYTVVNAKGEQTTVPPTRTEVNDFYNRRDQAAGIITAAVESGQHIHIQDISDDPADMWTKLQLVHNKQLPITRFNAQNSMLNITKDGEESYSDLMARVEQASELNKRLRPKEFTLEMLDDEMKSLTLIRALPKEDKSFVDGLMSAPSWSYQEVKEKLILYENFSKNRLEEVPVSANAAITSSSLPQKCTFCEKTNHRTEDCYAFQSAKTYYKSKRSNKQQNKNNGQKQANIAEEKAEFAGTASAFISDGTSPSGLLSSAAGADWVADSGATSHMTPHRVWFHDYKPYVVPIRLANGVIIRSEGVGTIIFKA